MNKIVYKTQHAFLAILLLLVMIDTFLFIAYPSMPVNVYILFVLNAFLLFISFNRGLLKGLIYAMVAIFCYGTYLIYLVIDKGQVVNMIDLMWIVVFPISSYLAGYLGDHLIENLSISDKYKHEIEKLGLLDTETGFGNRKKFLKDLEEEVNKARRFDDDLVLLVLKVKFLDDFKSIYGKEILENSIMFITKSIDDIVRIYDKKFRLENDVFALILPKTNLEGGCIVKNRLNEKLSFIDIDKEDSKKGYKFSYKIGLIELEEEDKDSFLFKERALREMEYDVG